MSKATTAPKCMVCGSNHCLRDPHRWTDEPSLDDMVAKVMGKAKERGHKPEKVATKPKNVATSNDNVATRRISIRELNQGISKHFTKLPFIVTKNGKDIARVIDI